MVAALCDLTVVELCDSYLSFTLGVGYAMVSGGSIDSAVYRCVGVYGALVV